ncbi:MAG: right-handed parallel beta-helix repeat-containing protein [candidate division KSB1 bacterium]|nr:right-handed parallel beta-helix repeat-containing protein [candidate division KSB1 bacterium]
MGRSFSNSTGSWKELPEAGQKRARVSISRLWGVRAWRKSALVLWVVFAAVQHPGMAADYYVSPGGDDRNPGTFERPFLTVAKAVEVAQPGDVVHIRAGVYSGIRIFPAGGVGRSGTPDRPIVYRAFGDGEAIIRGMVWIEAEYIEFHGLKITNPSGHGVFLCGARTPAGSGSFVTNHIRFVRCEIYECMGIGVLTDYDVHHNEFLYCNVHHNGKRNPPKDGEGQGFYVGGDYNRFIGNEIHDNADNGLQIWASRGWGDDVATPTGNVIVGNKVYRNGFAVNMAGIVVGAACGGDSNLVANNLIYGNRTYGLHIAGSLGKDNRFVNNTIFGNETGIAIYSSAGPNTVVLNNVVFGNPINLTVWRIPDKPDHLSTLVCDYNLWDPSGSFNWVGVSYGNSLAGYVRASGKDQHSFAADPRFVDPQAGDFRLRADSPAIDAGILLPDVESDALGVPRPQGSGPDLGAHEFANGLHVVLTAVGRKGPVPLRVEFFATVVGGSEPYTFVWDFGDGTTAVAGTVAAHLYEEPGHYIVRLQVTDGSGMTGEATLRVEATEALQPRNSLLVREVRLTTGPGLSPVSEIVPGTWYRVQVTLGDSSDWPEFQELVLFLSGPASPMPQAAFDPRSNYGVKVSADGRLWALETPGDSTWTEISGRSGLWVDASRNSFSLDLARGEIQLSVRLLAEAASGRWYILALAQDRSGSWTSARFPITVRDGSEIVAELFAQGPVADSTGRWFYQVLLTTSRPVVRIPAPLFFVDKLGNRHLVTLEGTLPGSTFYGRIWRDDAPEEGWGRFELGPGALADTLGNEGSTILQGQSMLLDWPPKRVANPVATSSAGR